MHVHARNGNKRARTCLCNYECACLCNYACAWIDLKFFLVVGSWVYILIFKFEKNPFSGCGEINVLLIRGPIQKRNVNYLLKLQVICFNSFCPEESKDCLR